MLGKGDSLPVEGSIKSTPLERGRKWLAEAWKTAKKQPIASSSMPSSSTKSKEQSTESQKRLASFGRTQLCILNPECCDVEIEHQLPFRGHVNVVAFRNKLVFISGGSRRVNLMDLSTGQLSSLPNMINDRCLPVGVAPENEIFVFGTLVFPGKLTRLLQEGEWSLLPPMIEERFECTAVNIPDFGVLVIGGIGRNGFPLRSTELLMRRSGEVEGGGGEKWQWIPFPPMNKEHDFHSFAVYFRGRVCVIERV
ncbi:unnamed protein product [Hymenolepis diminuta]|uniref:F-box/kelch-repeat protein SKIP30 n=1 Tax=Hymenolepis diminuta TaxID=6216 RepID=A0A0R3SYJ0_HYMDI|nr:unnamed protein product [Hymenolepis diminuta]